MRRRVHPFRAGNGGNEALPAPENDFYAAKVDPRGNVLWIAQAGDGISNEHVASTAVDTRDDVIMTGHEHGATGGIMTAKWDAGGTLLWWDVVTIASGEGYVVGTNVNDNVYVGGTTFGSWGGFESSPSSTTRTGTSSGSAR